MCDLNLWIGINARVAVARFARRHLWGICAAVSAGSQCVVARFVRRHNRPEPYSHVVEATGNTVRCVLPSGRIAIQFLSDDDANCFDMKGLQQEILTEVVSLGITRSFWSAGHLYQVDLASSCGGSPKDLNVSSCCCCCCLSHIN